MKTLRDKKEIIEFADDIYEDLNWYKEKDVKEAVLKFKQFMNDFGVVDKKRFEDCELFQRYNEIFGDWEDGKEETIRIN